MFVVLVVTAKRDLTSCVSGRPCKLGKIVIDWDVIAGVFSRHTVS